MQNKDQWTLRLITMMAHLALSVSSFPVASVQRGSALVEDVRCRDRLKTVSSIVAAPNLEGAENALSRFGQRSGRAW